MELDNKERQKRIELIKDELTDLQGQLKEEPVFKIGTWYKQFDCNGSDAFILSCFQGNDINQYGFTSAGGWSNSLGTAWMDNPHVEEATKEEVEKALIKEAKRRGFKKGATISKDGINSNIGFDFKPISECFKLIGTNTLDSNANGYIFKDGKWATIIQEKEMTLEEIEEELGYKIKIV